MTEIGASTDRRYASRKFRLAACAFFAGSGFFIAGMLTGAEWMTFTQWIVGLYMAGNVGDTAAERMGK